MAPRRPSGAYVRPSAGKTRPPLGGPLRRVGEFRETEMAISSPPAAGHACENSAGADRDRLREERALFARYLDGRARVDREDLVERFLPLAHSLARRYERPSEPFDDIFQVACLGLIKAIDRFDPSRDVSSSSYAIPTILGEIKRYYRDHSWTVRMPRELKDRSLLVARNLSELSSELGRQPSVAELARACGLEDEQVLERRSPSPASGSAAACARRSSRPTPASR